MLIISEFMNKEHAQLDELWLNVLQAYEDIEKAVKASELLDEYKKMLLLHMKLEDDYLFPRISLHLGFEDDAPLIARARDDHKILLKLLALTEEAFLEQNIEKTLVAGNNFKQASIKHHERESEIQYPVSDKFISEEEWQEILKSIY